MYMIWIHNERSEYRGRDFFLYKGKKADYKGWKFTQCSLQAKKWLNKDAAQQWAHIWNVAAKKRCPDDPLWADVIEVLYEETFPF